MGSKEIPQKPIRKYKPFHETFNLCAFALAIGLIYPNKNNLRARWSRGLFIISLNSLMLYWFTMYLFKCLLSLDMVNFARNITVGILILLFFFKFFYVNLKNDEFGSLLDKISEDLLKANDLDEGYQKIYDYYIKQSKFGQTCWMIIPFIMVTQFPGYAGVCMIFTNERYMLHEMELKHLENKQYDSPYFEMVFIYNFIGCIVLGPNFAGFDGSFCIATTHLRLKLKLMTHKLHRAFKTAKSHTNLIDQVKESIKDHQQAMEFYSEIQNIYGGWLFSVFLLTSFVISFNLYQIHLSQRVDPKYTIFALSGVLHMFVPCYFSATLTQLGEDLCSDIYDVPWEAKIDLKVTKLLTYMIFKSQQKIILTGNEIVIYNMQLFISMLQTSYSVFTLITNNK